ncbi:pentatricopeptide repeat-containing protein [Tanacetum coccineum]|uniref:Pentatricopeptide repeat-containing protein n=1 Tax=Tanacetum coccineum TaxID=301880 RepID=A0ABQ5GRC4_9ASTR
MAPSGSSDLLFDVHNNGVFFFLPLRLPECDLEIDLKLIENDSDLFAMYDYAGMCGILDMYVAHIPQKLEDFYCQNLCLDGSGDEVISGRRFHEIRKKDVGNMSYEELISWVEEEAEQLNPPPKLKTVTKAPKGGEEPRVVDKGKAKMLDDELVVKRRKATVKNKGIVIEENKNPTFINDTSSDSDSEPIFNNNVYSGSDSESSYSDKSVDYLSEGEDELIELRKRKNEAMRAPKQLNMKTPSDDVDHIGCSRPKSVFDIHHVGERFVDAEQLKECMTYYALANGFSLWFYRNSKDKVIAKCGLRPETVKDPSVGKQRKFYRYPSKGKHFGSKIRLNPHIKLHEIADLVMEKYKCIVSPTQCRNAKKWALNEGETTTEEHYQLIRSYGKALLESNVGSTVKLGVTVNPDEKTYFDRFYVCLNGLKQGWKLGCRRGLIEAVKEVMPHAEHRQCARHIYENFRKQFSGVQFRNLFWAASKATYPEKFNKIMDRIKRANPMAHQYLIKKEPKTWSRAHFEIGCNCEAVENGFSECFNSVLLQVRDKPLITMLEAMRVIVFERMNTMRNLLETWLWHVIPAGGNLFEVRNGTEAFKVNEQLRTCGCRMWQLSGLPCPHAIAVLFKLNKRPEDYVPACFRKGTYYEAYHQYLSPVGVKEPKPPCKKGRPPKTKTSTLIDEDEPIVEPYVTGQADIPNVNAQAELPNMNAGTIIAAGIAMRNSKIQSSKRGMGKKGNFVKKVRVGKFGRLGRWFGLNDGGSTSEANENSGDMPQVTTHQSQNAQRSQHVQADAPVVQPLQAEAEAQAQVRGNFRGGFVGPRQKSERIVKLKLGKSHSGVGS